MTSLISNHYTSIEQITDLYLNKNQANDSSQVADIPFSEILQQKTLNPGYGQQNEIKFSKHASMRLADRNITLNDDINARLKLGVAQAKEKGINESLVLVDELAFIVNVPNKTVVTAMDQSETKGNIFTNIDGAVIM